MSNTLPTPGKTDIVHSETIVRAGLGGPELMRLQEYWQPPVGHVIFVNGHGMEVTDTATFFHVEPFPHLKPPRTEALKTSIIDVKPRPEL